MTEPDSDQSDCNVDYLDIFQMLLDNEDAKRGVLGVFFEALGGEQVIEALIKHHEEGWSYRQLAELFGENESTVRNRMNRAMEMLCRHQLAPAHWSNPQVSKGRRRTESRPEERLPSEGLPDLAPAETATRCAGFSAHSSRSYGGGLFRRLLRRLRRRRPRPSH